MSERKPCLYETLLTQGKMVPSITIGGVKLLLDVYMPNDLVVCSPKFAADYRNMEMNSTCPDRFEERDE